MFLKTLVGIISLGAFATAIAQTDVSGTWMLNGPGTESEVLLTEEGKRLQGDYDLLVDDPSLYCTPASSSRSGRKARFEWAKVENTAFSHFIVIIRLF